jgi:hypothetical protein
MERVQTSEDRPKYIKTFGVMQNVRESLGSVVVREKNLISVLVSRQSGPKIK